mmetsp:Transcript_1845/g.7158  ORF Transcript_1845/g.7158 Transcript_1845/m.7158 type:complete len:864 (+) Transcript_1845:62-2653(+)
MPADIRSFFGGGPKKPAGDAAAKPKQEKLEEPAATVLPKKAKAEEPKPDVDMVDLTDDTPAPETSAKRKTVVDDDDDFVPDKSPPSAKKAKKTPTKKTPAKKEPVKELPKPPGYPKEESELKFSVIQGDQAWGYNDTRAEPPNKGVKIAPRGPNDCLEGVTVVVSGVLDSLEREEAEDYVKRHGGKVTTTVSGKTTYLLVGMDCGKSKYNKAKQHGTTLIDEDGLFAMVAACGEKPAVEEIKPEPAPAKSPVPTPKPSPKPAAAAPTAPPPAPVKKAKGEDEMPLWVNKYKPNQPAQLIGNGAKIAELRKFLTTWEDVHLKGPEIKGKDKPMKSVLISGAPGVGKSSAATIIAKQLGFEVMEVNASDTRGASGKDVKEGVGGKASNAIREMVTNRAVNFFTGKPKKMCLIMDEVDGMSGGDRGGVQELIACIKISKIPIICICNDKYNQKLKSLQNYTMDLPFVKPLKGQILKRMLKIAQDEGITMSEAAMEALIETCSNDIRQIINQLQMRRLTKQTFEFDDVKTLAKKDLDMGPFTAMDKLTNRDAGLLTVTERLNLVFQDSDLIPLFVQENYLQYRPFAARNDAERLQIVANAATCISHGDIMNRSVRMKQNWGLMPYANMVSSVMPASMVRGGRETFHEYERNFNRFPGWLGKNSSAGKMKRLLHEVHSHAMTSNAFKADSAGMRCDYLPLIKDLTSRPMWEPPQGKGKEGIEDVMEIMNSYCLTRQDWESVYDLCKFPKGVGPEFVDVLKPIATATKTAFTRACNAGSRTVHSGILVEDFKKKRGGKKAAAEKDDGMDEGEDEGEGGGSDEEDNPFDNAPKGPKLSAKRLAAIGFVAKDDGKKKKAPAKKKAAASKKK